MINRESWLNKAIKELSKRYFSTPQLTLPSKIMVSCGIPGGKQNAIGQCWDPIVTKDGTTHIFICPSLVDPVEILSTLLHELVHAAIGIHNGHNHIFKRTVQRLGLEGKPTATYAAKNSTLYVELEEISTTLGQYPHSQMLKRKGLKKVNLDKNVKLFSPINVEYTITIKESVLRTGTPVDPWGHNMVKKQDE